MIGLAEHQYRVAQPDLANPEMGCILGHPTEAPAYGQSRGVIPFSCAYLAADASTRGRTSA